MPIRNASRARRAAKGPKSFQTRTVSACRARRTVDTSPFDESCPCLIYSPRLMFISVEHRMALSSNPRSGRIRTSLLLVCTACLYGCFAANPELDSEESDTESSSDPTAEPEGEGNPGDAPTSDDASTSGTDPTSDGAPTSGTESTSGPTSGDAPTTDGDDSGELPSCVWDESNWDQCALQ